jgi:hypothetical protein
VPHLNLLWRLNILFPVTVAYAMVRYDLFDLRAVIRTGTIYGVVSRAGRGLSTHPPAPAASPARSPLCFHGSCGLVGGVPATGR